MQKSFYSCLAVATFLSLAVGCESKVGDEATATPAAATAPGTAVPGNTAPPNTAQKQDGIDTLPAGMANPNPTMESRSTGLTK